MAQQIALPNFKTPVFASGVALPDLTAYCRVAGGNEHGKATAKPWFAIGAQASATLDTVEVLIYGDIGESWYGDTVAAAEFVKSFGAINAKNITIRINSLGGSVRDGVAIYNAIRRHPATVRIEVEGWACSVASLIAMAGNSLVMAENALMMIHAPWSIIGGNATQLREFADMLDKCAESMATCYVQKTGKTNEEILPILLGSADYWLTAADALAGGWIDGTIGAAPKEKIDAFAATVTSRYASAPNHSQSSKASGPLALPPAANGAGSQVPDRSTILATDQKRREAIITAFAPHITVAGARDLEAACLTDYDMTPETAGLKLLALLSQGTEPVAGAARITTVEDHRDKFRAGVSSALMARAKLGKDDPKNEFRGYSLRELARECLAQANYSTKGMDASRMIGAAFTHTTSDFPNILTNIVEKSALKGFDEAMETFHLWTNKGTLTDYRPGKRLDIGSFPALEKVDEGAEYSYATIGDRGETIQLSKYGKRFSITREVIINDDMDYLAKLPMKFGQAAKRTIGNLVYAVITSNPAMSDGKPLFHADHRNLDRAALISSASVDSMDTKMALQKVGDEAGLNIPLGYLLVPRALKGRAEAVRTSQFAVNDTPDANNAPNTVRETFGVIADARLDAASSKTWYGVANKDQFDTIEVSYLDGVEVPTIETMAGWSVDGVEFKIRQDVGVKALEYRTFVKNEGR